MPYIDQNARKRYAKNLESLINQWHDEGHLAGHLTYIVYSLLIHRFTHKRRFTTAAVLIGATVCAILEFYRRKVAKYEDEKIEENGDV